MSTDKTLADAQPGGRVRLGDQAERAPWRSMDTCPRDGTVVRLRWGEDHVSPGWWSAPVSPVQNDDGTWPSDTGGFPWAFIDFNNGSAFVNHAVDTEYGPTHWAPYAALSAQPSPSGQDAPRNVDDKAVRQFLADRAPTDVHREEILSGAYDRTLWFDHIRELMTALAARQPLAEQHPDDLAVDAFAAAMKAKMAAARAKGRGGWEDPAQCSAEDLSRMLRDHVEKGDPRDVANFCMMLHQRGESVAARQSVGKHGEGDEFLAGICVALQCVTAQDSGVLWAEIVRAVGVDDLLQYATFIEPEEWDLAGFSTYASIELGRRKPRSKASKQAKRPPAQAVDLQQLERFDMEGVPTSRGWDVVNNRDATGEWVRFADVRALIDSQAVGK